MLVLSRKANEGIVIGKSIRVVVVEIRQGTVRVGIDAPRDVSVARDEVQAKADEAKASTGPVVESCAEILNEIDVLDIYRCARDMTRDKLIEQLQRLARSHERLRGMV